MTGISNLSSRPSARKAGHDTEKSISPDNLKALKARAERPTPGRMYEMYKIVSTPSMFTAYPPVVVTVDRVTKHFCTFHGSATGLKGRVYLPSESLISLFVPIHTRTRP